MFVTEDKNDLPTKMQYLLSHPEIVERYRAKVIERVRRRYSWEKITKDYEKLFRFVIRNGMR